jgi:hypothetical protein
MEDLGTHPCRACVSCPGMFVVQMIDIYIYIYIYIFKKMLFNRLIYY